MPPTQRAGCTQCAPVSDVLQLAPSAAAAVQEPANGPVQVPPLPHTATLVGLRILFAPHVLVAKVSAMHVLLVAVLQPTWCPTSHSSCPTHGSPTLPAFGLTQLLVPAGHTVLVLTLHDPWTQGSPGLVTG